MKKLYSIRIPENIINEINELTKENNMTTYKVIENALIIGIKYMRKKGFGIDSAIRILISAYNKENPENKI